MFKLLPQITLLSLLFVPPVQSATVNLDCKRPGDTSVRWKASLDESNSKASLVTVDSGYTIYGDAFFGPKYINWARKYQPKTTLKTGKVVTSNIEVLVRLDRETGDMKIAFTSKYKDEVVDGHCVVSKKPIKPLLF